MLSWILGIFIGAFVATGICLLTGAWRGREIILEAETRQRLESLHAIPLPIAISEHGHIVFRNTAWEQEMPHAPDAADWDEWQRRVMPPNAQHHLPTTAINGGSVRAERFLRTASGAVLQWTAAPFQGMGRRLVLNIIRDVTPLAQESMETATFLDKAAHELKTPVTAIRGYSELLGMYMQQQREITPHVVDRIVHQSDRLVRLTDELLDVGRLAAGRLKDDPTPLFLPVLLEERIKRFRAQNPDRDIRLEADSVHTLVDPERLAQITDELLSNALQFSDAPQAIDVHLSLRGHQLYLSVSDQGLGIAPQERDRVTEKFFRASNVNQAKRAEGFGLGLYLVTAIVEGWGGHVEVESAEGQGTRVTVIWPHREVFRASGETVAHPPSQPAPESASAAE